MAMPTVIMLTVIMQSVIIRNVIMPIVVAMLVAMFSLELQPAGLEPLTIGMYVNCSTTVQPWYIKAIGWKISEFLFSR
jgi:hypothetical protein